MTPTPVSREIPRWLLAVLLALAIAAITLFAPGAQAEPMNCQADNATVATYDRYTFWPTCGWYVDSAIDFTPVVVVVPLSPVPEPATWLLFLSGGLLLVIVWRFA
jgi:hypothetical protein